MELQFATAILGLILGNDPPAPAFRGIGDRPGGDRYSEVSGISPDGGTVVGWSSSAASAPFGERQAFRWTAKDGMVALKDLDGGPVRGNAGATSFDGSVIVGDSAGDDGSHAVYWKGGEVFSIGAMSNGGHPFTARGVSPDGRRIVGCATLADGYEAFVWSSDGIVGLGDLEGGATNSSAQTITQDGKVVFGTATAANGALAFRWTPDDGMVPLGDLPGGGTFSEPYGATPDGLVCVGRSLSRNSGYERFEGFRWSDDDGMVGIGDLEGGAFESWALGVSADGATIVGFGTTERGQEAMLWTEAGGMRRIADLIADDGIALDDWTLAWACGISGDGRVICGYGTHADGATEGWIWRRGSVAQSSALKLGAWHDAVFDESLGRVVLVNGGPESGKEASDPVELWSWDGAAWSPLASVAEGPRWRNFAAIAFDAKRRQLVLHGGVKPGGADLDDTWLWDGRRWMEAPGPGPGPREGAAMAFDSKRDRVVLFGGAHGDEALGDTWEWDGAKWSRVATTGPSPRFPGAFALDAARGQVVFFGGHRADGQRFETLDDTWTWDGKAWTQVVEMSTKPSARDGARAVFDPAGQRVLLFGGAELEGGRPHPLADTWSWNGTAWRQLATDGPPPRAHAAMAWDAKRGRLVLTGGSGGPNSILGDTWEFDGTRWRRPGDEAR